MTRWARVATLVATVLAAACDGVEPSRSQALVVLDTDAWVPQMFDRARVEWIDARGRQLCPACVREFAFTPADPWPVSLGIVPSVDSGPAFLRVRLYPAGRLSSGEPTVSVTIDRVVQVRFGSGVVTQTVFLPMACVGSPADVTAGTSCDASGVAARPIGFASASASATHLGSWHAEVTPPCSGNARTEQPGLFDGDVCVRGGVYWMGDLRVQGEGFARDAVPEHAVAVRSFYLDQHEYTVGRYRAALAAGFAMGGVTRYGPCGGNLGPNERLRCSAGPGGSCPSFPSCCTFHGPNDASADALPLDCIARDTAVQLCAFEGRRLASEAEWEWAAGNGSRETLFPWGDDPPGCGDLVGIEIDPTMPGQVPCPDFAHVVPNAVGTTPRDETLALPLFDLAGNVSEFVIDDLQAYGAGCWATGSYGVDPVCRGSSPDNVAWGAAVRGGTYASFNSGWYAAPHRWFDASGAAAIDTGFRCARDGS